MSTYISIVIPVFDEAGIVAASLARLAPLRSRGCELIVSDGGSRDDTPQRARPLADRVIAAPRGRAAQMNAGAAQAAGEVLLFLHIDSQLPVDADRSIARALAASGRVWGRFDIAIAGRHRLLPVVAGFMNLRSRVTGICTGDQGIFVRRDAFAACGGFPEIALMEDIALSAALKRLSPPLCLAARIVTSGRRWERQGAWRTVFLMWRLRLAYFFGADPRRLASIYDRND